MNGMSPAKRTLLVMIALAALQILVYWTRLPDTLASSFDGAGVPQGWSGKGPFFLVYIAMLALVYGSFITLPRWQQTRLERSGTEAWRVSVLKTLQPRLVWLGVVHLVLMIATVQLVIDANLSQRPLSGLIYWLLGAYFVFLTLWLLSWFASVRAARP